MILTRLGDGSVQILIQGPQTGGPIAVRTLNAGDWVAAVVTMSAPGERPGDWSKFIDHHQGRKDVLQP